nr:movement protein [Ipomoea batatas]
MLPFVRHVEKPEYQNYGKLTFIEIDDVINYKLLDHPSKTLFDVKRANKEKGEIMIRTNTRDLSCGKDILLSVFEEEDFTKIEGYYHVALVQVMVMWLGNTMQDIPLTIVALDDRLADEKQKIMGIFSSNLYPGATYTELYTDLTISARDPTKLQDFLLNIKAKMDFEVPQSLGLSVSLKVTYSWTPRPQTFRIRDNVFNPESRIAGRSIYIKPTENLTEEKCDEGKDLLNALKQYDPRPPTGYRGRLIGQKSRPTYWQNRRTNYVSQGAQNSNARQWEYRARVKMEEEELPLAPNLGQLTQDCVPIPYQRRVPDKGETIEERLKYMVATMTDFARIWWSNYETTPEYEVFLNAFKAGEEKGDMIGAVFRIQILGITDEGEEEKAEGNKPRNGYKN